MLKGAAKLLELIFCGKRVSRTVLVLYKYCSHFRDFVGICSNLVLMWKVPLDKIAEQAKKYQPKPKITYKMIQEYVEKKYAFKYFEVI